MRKILFHLSILIGIYLVFSFFAFDIWWVTDAQLRGWYIFVAGFAQFFSATIYINMPKWLETPTHEEKKTGIRKYIGELHEELKLYGEAMDLQKRISEFRKTK